MDKNMPKNIYRLLVNKKNLLPPDWEKHIELVTASDIQNEPCMVEKITFNCYKQLEENCLMAGIKIGIYSAYRTAQAQQAIYKSFKKLYGAPYADKIVAPVNTSEHQTGLAIDISVWNENHFCSVKDDFWSCEPLYRKIHPLLTEHGFILRYPQGKEEMTGYPYEPWHIRYVGKKLAKQIGNLSMEEYFDKTEKLSQYTLGIKSR